MNRTWLTSRAGKHSRPDIELRTRSSHPFQCLAGTRQWTALTWSSLSGLSWRRRRRRWRRRWRRGPAARNRQHFILLLFFLTRLAFRPLEGFQSGHKSTRCVKNFSSASDLLRLEKFFLRQRNGKSWPRVKKAQQQRRRKSFCSKVVFGLSDLFPTVLNNLDEEAASFNKKIFCFEPPDLFSVGKTDAVTFDPSQLRLKTQRRRRRRRWSLRRRSTTTKDSKWFFWGCSVVLSSFAHFLFPPKITFPLQLDPRYGNGKEKDERQYLV